MRSARWRCGRPSSCRCSTPPRSRSPALTVGFAILLAGVIGWAGRSILESQVTNSLTSDASLRPAVRAVVSISTVLLGEIIGAFLLIGAVVVVAAWVGGPARPAVAGRRAVAPYLRERPAVMFAVVAALMVLVFIWDPIPATGTPIGIVVFLALALFGTEMLRRQTVAEFPDAGTGAMTASLRARWREWRERRDRTKTPATSSDSLSRELARLAELRAGGSITEAEYAAAKARLLGA